MSSAATQEPMDVESPVRRDVIWTEKHRPKTVDDIASQNEVVDTLRRSIASMNLPHLLFYGPPGTGKTSTILAVARQIYGEEFRNRVMELNASDERGIQVVRHKVKDFASVQVSTRGGKLPPYKLIILDEADSMTDAAQAALRRTMETHSKTTRFCLICNYVSRIIDPLASRCAKFRFRPVEDGKMRTRLEAICAAEGLAASAPVFDALAETSGGDMRKAITYLQSAARFYGREITADAIVEIAGRIPDSVVADLVAACRSNSFESLQAAIEDVIAAGYPGSELLARLHDHYVRAHDLSNYQKAQISVAVAEGDKKLSDRADEFLVLLDVCAVYMRAFAGPKAMP